MRRHHQHAWLGHLFDGRADAFASQPGILDAAEGHRVQPPARRVAHNQRAHFEFAIGGENAPGVAREQPGLQSELRVIHPRQRIFKIVVRLNRQNRPKDLLVVQLHARRGRGQDRRRHHRPLALAACHQLGAAGHCLLHPRLHPFRFANPDQRAHLCRLMRRVAHRQLAGNLHHLPQERSGRCCAPQTRVAC